MEEGKINAFLKWVNSAEIGEPIYSLKQLSSGSLLLKILYLIDQDYRAEDIKFERNERSSDLLKVISYLENFYQQSLTSFINQNEISCYESILEIGKVLSLLLCCAVQGDNVGLFVEKITNMDEEAQLHLKNIIEAVLKEVECGKINTTNITSVLRQSVSVRELQEWENDEYHSSPITCITSPVFKFNSPIKALMASPRMQSRQSQMTISKLYKKLNQLQMKINSQQHITSDLEHKLEEKNEQIEVRDLKISTLVKEVSKIRGLEDEIQSLSSSEKELEEVKIECERIKRKTEELQKYKEQFLKLEKEFSEYISEKNAEKIDLESRLKEMESRSQDRILNLESSLEEKNIRNNRMKIKLLEASSVEAALKDELIKVKDSYKVELERMKASFDESRRREEELCQKKDQEIFRQVARETELKNCFKERATSLEVTIDQLQLQNSHQLQNMEQLRHELQEKEKLRKRLECDLIVKERELKEVVCKYSRLQTEFNLLKSESRATDNTLCGERNAINEALYQTKAETKLVKNSLCRTDVPLNSPENINKALKVENLKMCEKKAADVSDILKEKRKENLLLKETKASIQQLQNDLRAANDKLVYEKGLLKEEINNYSKKLSTKEEQIAKLLEIKNRFNKYLEKKEVELEKLTVLTKEKDEEITLDFMKKEELLDHFRHLVADIKKEKMRNAEVVEECEKLQTSLRASSEEKASLMEKNVCMKDKVKQLAILSKDCENLQQTLEVSSKERASLMKETSLKKKVKLQEPLSNQCEILQKSPEVVSKEVTSLMTDNISLKEKVKQLETLLKECENLQRIMEVSSQEKNFLVPAISSVKEKLEQLEPPSKKCENFQRTLLTSSVDKASVIQENILLKKRIEQLESLSREYENVQLLLGVSSGENVSLIHENVSAKEIVEQLQRTSRECDNLHNSHRVPCEEVTLTEDSVSLREQIVSLKTENLSLKRNIEQLTTKSKCKKMGESSKEQQSRNEKLKQLEPLSKELEYVQVTLETSYQEKAFLKTENKSLQGKTEQIDIEACHNKEILHSLLKENELVKSKLIATACTLTALRGLLTETRKLYGVQREDMVKIHSDLRACYEKIINQHSQCKRTLDEKDRIFLVINQEKKCLQTELEKATNVVHQMKEKQTRINEEKDFEIEKLQENAVTMQKRIDNLEEIRERIGKECSKELEKAMDLKRQLKNGEDETKKLNENPLCLKMKEEIQKLRQNKKFLDDENCKFKERISELEENVTNLEKKLSEEEFISKRLAMEVRSLEAQLVYADRQLRQKLVIEETQQRPCDYQDSNRWNVLAQSVVTTDSVVSECNLLEDNKDQEALDNQDENDKLEENLESSSTDHLEVKRRLRRRSALYQMKDNARMGAQAKRCSTVGGTFFVVDQFTTQEEPAEFDYDYDWDRIVELQRRNAACPPHMRSSYPVETQIHTEQEVREEELKSGYLTTYLSRKRPRDNTSNSNLNVTFQIPNGKQSYHSQTLPKSKSDEASGLDDHARLNTLSKRMSSTLSSLKSSNKDENLALLSSDFCTEQLSSSDDHDHFARRESIAFHVNLSPPKKVRPTFTRNIHRSFGKSDLSLNEEKEAVRSKTTKKRQGLKKFPLPRKPNPVKSDKKPLTSKNTNSAEPLYKI